MKNLLSFLPFLLPALLFAQGQRYYVNINASGQNSGLSWADAYTDLHSALQAAQDGDEVWVAEGTFKPSQSADQKARFEPVSGVKLYGGFAGDETSLSQRPQDKFTILSGDLGVQGDSADNSYTIMLLRHPDSTTLIDGFHFRDGFAGDSTDYNGRTGQSGGAIYIEATNGIAYPLIRNCVFENNSALGDGGAVYINGKGSASVAPGFEDCLFFRNEAIRSGGAICKTGASWWDRPVDILNCVFLENRATLGASININESERSDIHIFKGCIFDNNNGNHGHTLLIPFGRENNSSRYVFKQCTIQSSNFFPNSNHISLNHYFYGGDVKLEIDSCRFIGLIYAGDDVIDAYPTTYDVFYSVKITNSVFEHSNVGVRLYSNSTFGVEKKDSIFFIRNRVVDNSDLSLRVEPVTYNSDPGPGLIALENNYVQNAAISTIQNRLRFINNIVSDSRFTVRLDTFQSLFLNNTFIRDTFSRRTSSFTDPTKAYLFNNIFYQPQVRYNPHPGPEYYNAELPFWGDTMWLYNCLITGVDSNYTYPFGQVILFDSTTLFDMDPFFIDPDNGDYHLSPCSPAVNAGSNAIIDSLGITTDLEGNPRILEGQTDMGAFEHDFALRSDTISVFPACLDAENGSLQWQVNNGCPPYVYTWTNDLGETGHHLDSLKAGVYSVTVTDSKGRSSEIDVGITRTIPSVELLGDTLLCAGEKGALAANILGSEHLVPPYIFNWSTGDTLLTLLSDLGPGTYEITLTDARGCSDSTEATIVQVPVPVITDFITNATAIDSTDGSIEVEVSGGVPPIVYVWNTGDSTSAVSALAPGTYSLVLFDGSGCSYGYVFEVGVTSSNSESNISGTKGRVYPNPASSVLFIDWPKADEWHLFNGLGQKVCESYFQVGKSEIPISQLPAGLYHFTFYLNGKTVYWGRVVVE